MRHRRIDSIVDAIGNTPLVRLRSLEKDAPGVAIYLKLEFCNPGGSVKDRPGLRMVQDALADGRFRGDKILIDSTSGNTGVAYSLLGAAYGFKVHRMWRDETHFDRAGLWVYRLFAYQPGQRFPDQRLHFAPIPADCPRERRVRTSIRIQHLAGATEDRRRARFEKYREADPNNEFQHSYRELLDPGEQPHLWLPRHPDLPVLIAAPDRVAATLEDALHPALDDVQDRPVLSAIVISRDDGERLLRAVASVVAQESPWPFEVIVVASGTGDGAALVREQFPEVTVVDLPAPALPGAARNAGLRLARGAYVSFPGSHIELRPGSLAARMRAHDRGYAMVTGTMLNGTRTWAGWASYFLDHSSVLPGRR